MSNDKWKQDYEQEFNREIQSINSDPYRGDYVNQAKLRELEQAKRDIKK